MASKKTGTKKPLTKRKGVYPRESLRDALKAVKEKGLSVKRAARVFGVPRTTLSDIVNNKYPLDAPPRTVLTPAEEEKVVKWILETSHRGQSCTTDLLFSVVQKVLTAQKRTTVFKGNKPGRTWLSAFFKRHPEIKPRNTTTLKEQKAQLTEENIRAWFTATEENLTQAGVDIKDVPPAQVFNVDAIVFPVSGSGQISLSEAVATYPFNIEPDNRSRLTILGCASASGQLLPPLVIYPGKRLIFHPEEDFPEAFCCQSEEGSITTQIFHSWLEDCFIPQVKDLPGPILLFVDEHTSYINMETHHLCNTHGIEYQLLPTYVCHVIQPLDLVYYGHFKKEWKEAISRNKKINKVASVTLKTFMPLFRDVWGRAFDPDHVITAFRKSGLCPWSPDVLDYGKNLAKGKAKAKAIRITTITATEASDLPDIPDTPEVKPLPDSSVQLDPKLGVLIEIPGQTPQDEDMEDDTPPPSTDDNQPKAEESHCETGATPRLYSLLPKPQCQSRIPDHEYHIQIVPGTHQPDNPPKAEESHRGTGETITIEVPTPSFSAILPEPQFRSRTSDHEYHRPNVQEIHVLSPRIAENVDALLDLVISTGWSASDLYWIRRRHHANVPPKEGEHAYRQYVELYDSIVPPPSFNNFPVPQGRTPRLSNSIRAQPSIHIIDHTGSINRSTRNQNI